jgi:hypothetical protein
MKGKIMKTVIFSPGNACRKIVLQCIIIAILSVLLFPVGAMCSPKRLVESSDYSDKGFRKGIITNYTDMVEGDDIGWIWINPAEKLAQYKLKVGKTENKSEIRSKSMVESVKNIFRDTFADTEPKGNKGTLIADLCIYEAENFSAGKAWIPFVGGHQMQAGIGIEMVLHDARNRTVAKFRHSAREGVQIEAAAQEVAGDLMKYIADH